MIFSSLRDRFMQLTRPFSWLKKRYIWRGEQAIQQMEQRYTREAATGLKQQVGTLIENDDLSGENIDSTINDRKAALTRRLAPLLRAATQYATLTGQLNGIKDRVNAKLEAVRTQVTTLMTNLGIASRSAKISSTNHVRFKALIDRFQAAANPSPVSRPPAVPPPVRPAAPVNLRPRTAVPVPLNTPVTGPTASPTERYVINEQFKKQITRKLYDFTRTWSQESWVEGGPTRNDAITRFAQEYMRVMLETADSKNPSYQSYRGENAVYAFIADKMGGSAGTSSNNDMRNILREAYIPFELYGRGRRDTDSGFRSRFNSNRRDAYIKLRREFFNGLTVNIDGSISSTNTAVQRQINTRPERAVSVPDRANAGSDSQERAPETVPKFNVEFQQLRVRGISAARFRNYLSRYTGKSDTEIRAQLTPILATPANREVFLDAYDQGMAERFHVDNFARSRITPQTWNILSSFYEHLQGQVRRGTLTSAQFTESIRNFGTTDYPRMEINNVSDIYFVSAATSARVKLNVDGQFQNTVNGSSLYALKLALRDNRNITNLLSSQRELYLDRSPSFEQNASFLSFTGTSDFLTQTREIGGRQISLRDMDWGSFRSITGAAITPEWQQKLINTLAANQIEMVNIRAGVSVKEVFDHAAQFLALVESRSLRPGQSAIPDELNYQTSGIHLRFNAARLRGAGLTSYLESSLPTLHAFKAEKVAFAKHLITGAASKGLNLTPRMVLSLLQDDRQPINLGSGRNLFLTPPPSIDVYGNYLMIIKKGPKYVLTAHGRERPDISIDNTIAEAYFSRCRSRELPLRSS
jgi:hypothetical protein